MSKIFVVSIISAITLLIGLSLFQHQIPNPKSTPVSTPTTPNTSTKQIITEMRLQISYPHEFSFRKEIGDNYGQLRTAAFYIEKGNQNKPDYQLYGLFLADKTSSQKDLERSKSEMDKTTTKEITLAGYAGIEGLILGPKTHYVTLIIKDNKLYSFSTYPPTTENKVLTDQILKTISFK